MTPQELKDITNTTEKCEQLLVEYIRMHAHARYNDGWGYITEQWSDGDILEVLSDVQSDLPLALSHIQSMVDLHERKFHA
jgi:hypothetical protein